MQCSHHQQMKSMKIQCNRLHIDIGAVKMHVYHHLHVKSMKMLEPITKRARYQARKTAIMVQFFRPLRMKSTK
jgi:hypothetical protein